MAVILVSGIGSGVLGYYIWRTLTIPIKVEEPLEILNYPSELSLYPGEMEEFNITIYNHASVNYSVTLDFSLNNTSYQTNYVTFSNEIYIIIPGQQNLTAWLMVGSGAPPANASLTIDFKRGVYPIGLVGYWKFDEGNGIAAGDSSGNNNSGILQNGPVWGDGKYGKALSFDGIDDYVSVQDSLSLEVTNGITIAAWIYPVQTDGDRSILGKIFDSDSLGTQAYTLQLSLNGKLHLAWWDSTGNGHKLWSTSTVEMNKWSFVVGTYDGSYNRLYINGQLVDLSATSGTIRAATSTSPLRIGMWWSTFPNYFNGTIDEVMVYNRALSAEEVMALYTNPPV